MDSQKLENILKVALQTDKNERNSSNDSDVGFNITENTWELIVKYNGDLTFVRELGGNVEELILGYAIIVIPEDKIQQLIERPEIEYVEKPFILDTQDTQSFSSTGITSFKNNTNLTGKGTLLGIIDSVKRNITTYNDSLKEYDERIVSHSWERDGASDIETIYFTEEGDFCGEVYLENRKIKYGFVIPKEILA